jgi:para-aminobenzoate synthetase component I
MQGLGHSDPQFWRDSVSTLILREPVADVLNSGDWPGVVEELRPAPEAVDVFRRMCDLPHCIFFDSAAQGGGELGRYSFVAADPFRFVTAAADDRQIWMKLADEIARYRAPTLDGLPPFQGGLAGLFSYDLGRSLERLPRPRCDEFCVPSLAAGMYDVVVAFDHAAGRAWIVSQGFPETEARARHRRATERAGWVRRLIEGGGSTRGKLTSGEENRAEILVPQHPVRNIEGLTSNVVADEYLAIVRQAIDYIYAGDVFQVNLSQRLLYPAGDNSFSLYLRLRERNAAPFSGYFDLGEFQIISASPERFLKVRDGAVEARPIKGTRRRTGDLVVDATVAAELTASAKERAENVMIVDLLRNDLTRVCRPESVAVAELCSLEEYAHVMHLVSAVRGRLRDGMGPLDLLQAAFPGGSVTGAPKIRAMEIIAELEPTARGAYCGALAYIGFDGVMDASILIRTITAGRGWWQFPVGGGIVAESEPEREYEETWEKAEGMIRALE